jgi:alpha/beta superfamily hydrolase
VLVAIETHSLDLHTLDGVRLAADLTVPSAPPGPPGAAVLCHPHPLYGGDRHHPLLTRLADRLAATGVATIRFDFRGGGDSDGTHSEGVDERLDVVAAIDAAAEATDGPIWVMGYSFGAAVSLDVADPRAAGWVAVAPPLAMVSAVPLAATDHRPVHLLVPLHDQYSPPESVTPIAARWTATELVVIDSADHFLAGHLHHVVELAAAPIVASLG